MEKIQQDINFLSLLFGCFFVVELAGIAFGLATYQGGVIAIFELAKIVSFYGMIPLAILFVQLAAKLRKVNLLWTGIGIFILHIAMFIFYGFID